MRYGSVLLLVGLGLVTACSDDSTGPPTAPLISPLKVPSFQGQWQTVDNANDIAVLGNAHVLVSDPLNHGVAEYTRTGTFVGSWTPKSESGGETFPLYMDATSSPTEALYIVSAAPKPSRVLVFDATKTLRTEWLEKYDGNDDGWAGGVDQIAVSPSGDIYRLRYREETVVKYNAAGVFQAEWSTQGNPPGLFNGPGGIAVTDDIVYVSDSLNNRIVMFSTNGQRLGQFGKQGTGPGQFMGPNGLAIADQVLYVVDRGNDRIQKFTLGGKYLVRFSLPNDLADPLLIAVRGRAVYILQAAEYPEKDVVYFRYGE